MTNYQKQNLGLSIILVIIMILLSIALVQAIETTDRNNCIKWQEEANTKYNYWITDQQDELCRSFRIKIIAPIKG